MKQSFRNERLHVADAPTVPLSPLHWGPFTFQVGEVVSTKMGQGSYGEFKAKLQKQSWARNFPRNLGLPNAYLYIKSSLMEMKRCISFLKSGGNYSKQTSAWQCLLLLWEYKCLAAWWPRMRTPPFLTWGFATSRRRKTKRVKFMSGELFRGWQQHSEIINKVGKEQGERLFQRSGSQEQHTILHIRASRKCLWSP